MRHPPSRATSSSPLKKHVLCLAGDTLSDEQVRRITDAWLAGPFDGGRHERRVRKIGAIELGQDPVEAVPDPASA